MELEPQARTLARLDTDYHSDEPTSLADVTIIFLTILSNLLLPYLKSTRKVTTQTRIHNPE